VRRFINYLFYISIIGTQISVIGTPTNQPKMINTNLLKWVNQKSKDYDQ